MEKKKMKILIIVTSVAFALFVVIVAFELFWHYGKQYKDFSGNAEQEFAIPDLSSGFTPQGIATHDDKFLVCGYMNNEPSRIYVVDGNDVKHFTLTLDGDAYNGHCGGVSTYDHFGYVVGDGKIVVFDIVQALALEDGQALEAIDILACPNGADFVNAQGSKLYIGEFYHQKKYPTKESHHIDSADGTNPSLTYVYDLNNALPCGFDITTPIFAISTTEKIQGMCIDGSNRIVLSQSWSLSDSHLLVYKPFAEITPTSMEIDGENLDVYVLDSTNLVTNIVAPSMSEEITFYDGRVYIMFENASQKYHLFTRTRYKNCYSIDIDDFIAE